MALTISLNDARREAIKNVVEAIKHSDAVIAGGPFSATWESLENYRIPSWYQDAKFGIFIHWGVYSIPAFGSAGGSEWYPRRMYQQGSKEFDHHVKTYGPQSVFGYKDFIPMFKAQRFNATQWAKLFKKAGARYVIPVAEHHDGFAMYDCGFSKWTAAKMGPKRDIVRELAEATRKEGMIFGLSSHRACHWWFMNGGMNFDSDIKDPEYADFYGPAQPDNTMPDRDFLDDWLVRTCELVDKYQPQIVYFDGWIGESAFKGHLKLFAAYYYNRGAQWDRGVAINYKHDAYPPHVAVYDIERGQLTDIRQMFWQTDTAVAKNSWGYIHNADYKTPQAIIADLADIVSKNGAMLLNIGPRPDGTIPEEDKKILLEIGKWLDVNGEAIYGTRPWKVFGEGPTEIVEGSCTDNRRSGGFTSQDIRFTTRGQNVLYAIVLGRPQRDLMIYSLGSNLRLYTGKIGRVRILGSKEAVSWSREPGGLKVKLPKSKPCDHAFVLKIESSQN